MKLQKLRRRWISGIMLVVLVANTLVPSLAFALTSGPVQPEFQGFKPAGATDMVDLSTGDLQYNIPLLDMDGYPINLNYTSGAGMDDEASWVGLGWSLSTGAVNRDVRGLPDDFNGKDQVKVEQYTKPKVTVGGKVNVKAELFGINAGPTGKKSQIGGVTGTFTVGLFSDNYTGIGAEVGVNAGVSLSFLKDGMLTAGLGLGAISNTQSGIDASASPFVNMELHDFKTKRLTTNAGLSANLGYNTRSGLKSLSLGETFGYRHYEKTGKKDIKGSNTYNPFGSSISYNTEPVLPNVDVPFNSNYSSFSFDIGGALYGAFLGAGLTGYKSVTTSQRFTNKPAYGFLYADQGKNNANALMDFIREKDNPIIPEIPNIAIPIHTPDMWSYTSQAGSGQFRLYRGGSGSFFDSRTISSSTAASAGGDYGIGNIFHGGVTFFMQDANTVTQKWTKDNNYLTASGDFQDRPVKDPATMHASFKLVGEKTTNDNITASSPLNSDAALKVDLDRTTTQATHSQINGTSTGIIKLDKNEVKRRPTRTDITYLTAYEASRAGLDKTIKSYPYFDYSASGFYAYDNFTPTQTARFDSLPENGKIRRAHHISEIDVTEADGKRMVYGVPVYNYLHDEYTFAVSDMSAGTVTDPSDNAVAVPANVANNTRGIDNYYRKESRSPYATSYLLSGILSPDYVDKTGDGITNDDLGTAIKFNYSYMGTYRWRTPYEKATFNKASLADPDDNKGSVIFGIKELWYVSTIESKTQIAFFITEERTDAVGAQANWTQGQRDDSQTQRRLREIRLYSKGDLTKPVKVVHLDYDYSLCQGIPNSKTGQGKLTLTRVYFTYGRSDKGQNHPYIFTYNTNNPNYNADRASDRWGTYKPSSLNPPGLKNDYYPYSTQNKSSADALAAPWCLSSIELPTGGKIDIAYEAKDYAYVQDKRAMVMTAITGLARVDANGSETNVGINDLRTANALKANLTAPTQQELGALTPTQWFKNKYLNGSEYLYTKLLVKMKTGNCGARGTDNEYDYVPCYSKVTNVKFTGNTVTIQFEDRTEGGVTTNPIIVAAWQKMKTEYPRYAYPGFNNRIKDATMGVPAAISALTNAIGNLSEITSNFYKKAFNNRYACDVDLNKSFIKLTKPDGKKIGGGARVNQIMITDNWSTQAGGANSQYGQTYKYTATENGVDISSGVATYEPAIGNDENSLKQPLPYMQKIKGALNNYFNLELPFCESLYPAPSIVYSKVTVQDLGTSGDTGYSVTEFYTAKDFPTRVSVTPLQSYNNKPVGIYSLVTTNSRDERALSQGYCITLNDMSGKLKASRVFDKGNAEVGATVYVYRTKADDSQMLDNQVDVIDENNHIDNARWLGREIEYFTDFREQVTSNVGQTINLGGDIFGAPIPWPIPHFPVNINNEYKLFRSASALKVVQLYGILSKVIKTQNGSSVTSEDMVYDKYTGAPVVNRTQNEFNNYIYSVNLPAYWMYKTMGGAYQNSGAILADLTTNDGGEINAPYINALTPGDELIDLNDANQSRYWVVSSKRYVLNNCYNDEEVYGPCYSPGPESKFLMTREGGIMKDFNKSGEKQSALKLVRSGYRNIYDANAGSIVCISNPVLNNSLVLNSTTIKAINASAATYQDVWSMPEHFPQDQYADDWPYSTLMAAGPHPSNGSKGLVIYNSNGTIAEHSSNVYLQNRFNNSAVWPGAECINNPGQGCPSNLPLDQEIGFETDFNVINADTYYVGYGGNDTFKYEIDGVPLPQPQYNNPFNDPDPKINSNYYWYLYPKSLSQGVHHLKAKATNIKFPPGAPLPNDMQYNSGSMSIEIYTNTLPQLKTNTNFSTIFSTVNLRGNASIQTFKMAKDPLGQPVQAYRYRYHINPYIDGFFGNWRPSTSRVFMENRTYINGFFSPANKGVDVKNAGYFNAFSNYWNYVENKWMEQPAHWVTANTITLYDKYGQQLENKDAMGKYSGAIFSFNGQLPAAVAANTKSRDIFATSFEDDGFTPGAIAGSRAAPHFMSGTSEPEIVTQLAHSGNRCVKLPSAGLTLSTNINNHDIGTTNLLSQNIFGEYNTLHDGSVFYQNGFTPSGGSQGYMIKLWVYDGVLTNFASDISASVNNVSLTLTTKAMVEGWKLVEIPFTIPASSNNDVNIKLSISPFKTVYVDDIRILPAESQMKTYTYDNRTLRLMAELDENCMATYYEYDDEGTLIRVKKETEKGVITLKENRSAYKKRP